MTVDTNQASTVDPAFEQLQQIASEPTPHHEVRWRENKYPYTDPDYVIRKLNELFKFNWSFIVEHEEMIYFADRPFEIEVRGRLIVPLNGAKVTKMQYGAATIEYVKEKDTRKPIKPVMIADAYKSAASDALKKCASELGIAHDIYDSDSYLHKGGRNGQQQNGQTSQQQTTQSGQGQKPQPSKPMSTKAQLDRITAMWPTYGPRKNGALIPLADAVKQFNKIASVNDLTLEDAAKWLEWLVEKEQEAKKTATGNAPVTEPAHDPGVERIMAINDALLKIWCGMGKSTDDFLDYYKKNLKGKSEAELSQTLEKWQDAALKRQQAPAPPPKQQDKNSGLDQWACTKETGSRQLAMDLLNATERLERSGVTQDQWKDELGRMFGNGEPISRIKLTAAQCRELAETFNQWAASREQKAAKAAQPTQ